MPIIIICLFGALYCFLASFGIDFHSESSADGVYGALYALMAVIFLCTSFVVMWLRKIAQILKECGDFEAFADFVDCGDTGAADVVDEKVFSSESDKIAEKDGENLPFAENTAGGEDKASA